MNRTNDRLRFPAGLVLSLLLPVLAFPLAAVGQTDPSTPKTGPSQDSGDAQDEQKPKPILDLSGPRATMRTFLVAIQAASGAHPERIDDAVACLDTSKLEGDDVVGRARSLARRLHDLIDAQGVQLADIPEEAKAEEYFFYPADGQPGERHPQEIRLALVSDTGHWLFTPETLTSIPLLAGTLKERQPEEKPKAAETTVPATRRARP